MNLEASLSNILASEGKLPRLPADKDAGPKSLGAGGFSKKGLSKEIPSMFGPAKETPEKQQPVGTEGPEGVGASPETQKELP